MVVPAFKRDRGRQAFRSRLRSMSQRTHPAISVPFCIRTAQYFAAAALGIFRSPSAWEYCRWPPRHMEPKYFSLQADFLLNLPHEYEEFLSALHCFTKILPLQSALYLYFEFYPNCMAGSTRIQKSKPSACVPSSHVIFCRLLQASLCNYQ